MILLLAQALAVLALIVVNGFLSMSEAAFVASHKERLRQLADHGDAGARTALAFKADPTRFFATVQVGITLVGVLAGAFGGATFARPLAGAIEPLPLIGGYSYPIAFVAVVVAISYLSLVVGELAPKRIALGDPEHVVSLAARPLAALATVLAPVNALLTGSTRLLLWVLPVRVGSEKPPNEAEVRALLAQATQAGVFHQAEEQLVQAVFALGDLRVDGLMTPRPKIVWIELDEPVADQQRKARASGHDYFPVCRDSLDDVRGVIAAAEVWRSGPTGEGDDGKLIGPAVFVPEHLRAVDALAEFKRAKTHLLFVVDEHGTVVGLVTLTDVLQAIVGDVPGATAATEAAPVRRDDGSWLLDAAMPLADVRRTLDMADLSTDAASYQTLGGLVLHALDRVPTVGDHFNAAGWHFEVVDMDGHRVDRVLAMPIA